MIPSERNIELQSLLGIDQYDAFEREVIDVLIDVLEITNGDAQGMIETNDAQRVIRSAYMTGINATQCAETIANL